MKKAFLAILSICICLTSLPVGAAGDETRLVVGRISFEPRKHLTRLQALADYLTEQLADEGIEGIDVVIVDSFKKMRDLFRSGEVDIVSETAFMAVDLAADGSAELLLREWKGGVPEYHTTIIARRDGKVRSLEDLADHKFAFEDPGSTSAYLVPRAALEAAGLSLVALSGPRAAVPKGKVGYAFAEGEINVAAWVHRGFVDAGAISNLDWVDETAVPRLMKQDLMVIHETPPIIRSLLLVRSTLDPALKARIGSIFEHMHETQAGRQTLRKYFKVKQYDRIEGDALDALDNARKLRRLIGD